MFDESLAADGLPSGFMTNHAIKTASVGDASAVFVVSETTARKRYSPQI